MRVGDPDGFGRYGVVEATPEGLVCHQCGRGFHHLGLHVWRAHGITASAYRERHGLRRRGLVVDEIREQQRVNAAARMTAPEGQAFVEARDPAYATAVRIEAGTSISPAGEASISLGNRRRRRERVVVCEECGARFCPLGDAANARRRRFCSRSCSGRAHRAALIR